MSKVALSNFVIVKLFENTSEYKFKSGKSLLLSTEMYEENGSVIQYGDMNHVPSAGEVISVPEQLVFIPGVRHHNYMDWETSIEIEVGDIVIIRRLAIDKALGDGLYYEQHGHKFIFIKYESLIVARRELNLCTFYKKMLKPSTVEEVWPFPNIEFLEKKNKEEYDGPKITGHQILDKEAVSMSIIHEGWKKVKPIMSDDRVINIPLNGYVIIELLSLEERKLLKIPEKDSMKGSKIGRIVLLGSLNKAYHPIYTANYAIDHDGSGDSDNVKREDIIVFKPESWSELENSIHAIFTKEPGKTYYKIQRNRILAKIDEVAGA